MEKAYADAFEYIRKQYADEPEIGIVLGTGLGALVDQIEQEKVIPYNFIPHFPISTVDSHFGRLIFGRLGGRRVVAMQGRLHFYEGYSMQELTFPIRIMAMLGIHTLLISNAAGGLNPAYRNGDMMVLDDHINLQHANPLIGPNNPNFGPRFPDMSRPYDPQLIDRVLSLAAEQGVRMHKGIYVGVTGPNLETRAEYRMLRQLGGDVVGMSTVPEVLVARHMDLRVCAVSVVTDECYELDNLQPITLDHVIGVANAAEPQMTAIFAALVPELSAPEPKAS
ncbi:MAG: purine-nucleoside phosphorylase [Bacteroidetes bacterium]|nr:MAG: purine-nucleoside phosphorylase [Bacteroidota bacterium]